MGTNLYLIWNNECVADLGRTHNFKDGMNCDDKNQIIQNILSYRGYIPKDVDELRQVTRDMVENIDHFYEESHRKGQIDLLEDLKEQGFELMDEYEWEKIEQKDKK